MYVSVIYLCHVVSVSPSVLSYANGVNVCSAKILDRNYSKVRLLLTADLYALDTTNCIKGMNYWATNTEHRYQVNGIYLIYLFNEKVAYYLFENLTNCTRYHMDIQMVISYKYRYICITCINFIILFMQIPVML